jgi:ZIP family zinc transporter
VHTNLGIALLLSLLAGLSTTIGSVLGFFARRPRPRLMSLTLGFAAGVMILVSFVELLPQGVEVIGFLGGHMAFFGGMALMFLVDLLIPHHYMAEEHSGQGRARRAARRAPPGPWRWRRASRRSPGQQERLFKTAVLVAFGVGIHNFPEGVATFASALHDVRLGTSIALAIAIHNIPEGLAISVPVCAATGSRRKAFLWSFLSGMAEVAGALMAALFLLPFLNEKLLSTVLAAVAGVRVFISLDELVPVACSFGEEHLSILGVGIGMAVMSFSLWLLQVV